MDDVQKKYVAIALVAIVIIAAIGVAIFVINNNNKNDNVTVTFLVQDDEGLYFWMNGTAAKDGTMFDAFEDATKNLSIPFVKSTSTYGDGITSLFGLETKETESGWVWWSQKYWKDGSWVDSTKMMGAIKASEYSYAGIIYGDGTNTLSSTPSKAVAVSKDVSGYKFLIESSSGVYFKIGANGDNAISALKNACNTYNIPNSMNDSFLSSLFGMETKEVSESEWTYWALWVYNNGAWDYSAVGLNDITSNSNYIGLYYSDGAEKPVAP